MSLQKDVKAVEMAATTKGISSSKRRNRKIAVADDSSNNNDNNNVLLTTLQKIDPILQFLTKATGQTAITVPMLFRALPESFRLEAITLSDNIKQLIEYDIIYAFRKEKVNDSEFLYQKPSHHYAQSSLTPISTIDSWTDDTIWIGFPLPNEKERLHGSTKAAAKRRVTALKQRIKSKEKQEQQSTTQKTNDNENDKKKMAKSKCTDTYNSVEGNNNIPDSKPYGIEDDDEEVFTENEQEARKALQKLLGFVEYKTVKIRGVAVDKDAAVPSTILPQQVSYAGSNPAQDSVFSDLPEYILDQIPTPLIRAFGIATKSTVGRKLYSHQVSAIESAMNGQHVSVCTGTGSGKSLCFLLPVLSAAYNYNQTSLLMFPTKALAQDQLSRLLKLLQHDERLVERIRPATLDGDTPHSMRLHIAETCNIILTNPDTLHAAILPTWKTMYRSMISSLRYIVIDEAHIYDGVFGAHVAMVLRRLYRISLACCISNPIYIAASATLPWPEHHFRLLCPIPESAPICIMTSQQDGSPRSAKHFFVWNPPVLNMDATSTGKVRFPRPNENSTTTAKVVSPDNTSQNSGKKRKHSVPAGTEAEPAVNNLQNNIDEVPFDGQQQQQQYRMEFHRRHAAEETARLFAKAVSNGVRCIAFCKTRNLVEWVYSKALDALKSDSRTANLTSMIESYRGGYSMKERRKIEEKLFQNKLLGVVGTNALELGVDIGGIDVTLHCGYPSNYASLLQQAGRAGRGADRLNVPSVSIVVCFNSPSEQQIWKNPKSLLGKGISAPNTMSFKGDLVQGHLLCASEECPLAGSYSASVILRGARSRDELFPNHRSDREIFGPHIYDEAVECLESTGAVDEEEIANPNNPSNKISILKAVPSIRRTWSRVSLRSIEPINYAIVDLSHPSQEGRMDGIHDENAIMDTIPYSRVFYHAHPGSIITHRAQKFKIVSMTHPPVFAANNFNYRRSLNLAAYARPTNARYVTRPLSKLYITVIKQMEVVEICQKSANAGLHDCDKDSASEIKKCPSSPNSNEDHTSELKTRITFAGCGAVSVKREVHGYKKLSIINRAEISRSELSLPPIEYDTFGLYFCADPDTLSGMLKERYGPGVHALSHALLAVAPLFAPGLSRDDLQCDHAFYAPTQVVLFDERAGGSGCVERLWQSFFQPDGILEAAIDLLENCSACNFDPNYDGGCPACLHASTCIKFNMHLSKSAAIIIGKHMLDRIQSTDLYKKNAENATPEECTPRRKARKKAVQKAKEMQAARNRQFVVGRASWPLDGEENMRQVHG